MPWGSCGVQQGQLWSSRGAPQDSYGADMGIVGQPWGSRGSHHEMFDQDPGRDITILLLQGQGGLQGHQRPGEKGDTRGENHPSVPGTPIGTPPPPRTRVGTRRPPQGHSRGPGDPRGNGAKMAAALRGFPARGKGSPWGEVAWSRAGGRPRMRPAHPPARSSHGAAAAAIAAGSSRSSASLRPPRRRRPITAPCPFPHTPRATPVTNRRAATPSRRARPIAVREREGRVGLGRPAHPLSW